MIGSEPPCGILSPSNVSPSPEEIFMLTGSKPDPARVSSPSSVEFVKLTLNNCNLLKS